MIDRQHGILIIECDCCGATHDVASGDFVETWDAAKRDGWKSRKVAESPGFAIWDHSCPDCPAP